MFFLRLNASILRLRAKYLLHLAAPMRVVVKKFIYEFSEIYIRIFKNSYINYFSFLAHRQIFHDFLRIFLDILRHIEAQTLVMIVFPSGFDERTAVTAADLQQKQP